MQAKYRLRPLSSIVAVALICFGFIIIWTASGQQSSCDLHLTILHTNDLHAHDDSYTQKNRSIGGLARIGHLIRLLSKENHNTLIVDAGDIFQGTPFFTQYHGEVEVHLLNAIGYNLFTIGNHEFDEGCDNLEKQLKVAKFEVISSNLDCSQSPVLSQIVKSSEVKIINGEKVGFVGAVTPDLDEIALHIAPVKLKNKGASWFVPIKDEVEKLSSQGINKIVLISHCGVDRDQELAQAVPEIDAIVGGHSHTRLDKPIICQHPDGSATIIVQTGSYGRALGKLDLCFDRQGKLLFPDTTARLINITNKIYEENDLKKYIDEKGEPFLALRNEIVGKAVGDFGNRWFSIPWDSSLGDLISDAVYESGKKYGAQISFENRGGIRSNLEKGQITQENLEEMLPFNNTLSLGTMSGAALLAILDHSVGKSLGGRFLDEHGLKFAYDPDAEQGHRIIFALVEDAYGDWKPVMPNQNYRIAINSYDFEGGEGYDFSSATNKQMLKEKISQVLKSYLTSHPTVTPCEPSRIAPVKMGVLAVKASDKNMILHFNQIAPGSKATIIVGSKLGVAPIKINSKKEVPVPVFDPKIINRCVTNESSECIVQFTQAKTSLGKDQYLTAVIEPPPHTPKAQLEIAAPVPLP